MTLASIIERVEKGERSNELDVLIEVATFEADGEATACRANAAGTKVIYTLADGSQCTHWARDWTRNPLVLAVLRAKEGGA